MESNKNCEDQNVFANALSVAAGVALGGAAIMGGRKLLKGAVKKKKPKVYDGVNFGNHGMRKGKNGNFEFKTGDKQYSGVNFSGKTEGKKSPRHEGFKPRGGQKQDFVPKMSTVSDISEGADFSSFEMKDFNPNKKSPRHEGFKPMGGQQQQG